MDRLMLAAVEAVGRLPEGSAVAPPLGEPLDGAVIGTRGIVTWRSADGNSLTGIWECDAGSFHAAQDGWIELVVLVSGRMRAMRDDGSVVELGPGDHYVFTPDWSGVWEIIEPMRKHYAIFPA